MQVKFHENLYALTENGVKQTNASDGSNVLTLELMDITDLDALTQDAAGAEDIQILNGDSIYQEYLDYIVLRSVTLDADTGVVTVTVHQESFIRQINTLRERNLVLQMQISAQSQVIVSQGETIEAQSKTIQMQASKIAELEQSQEEQDTEITEIQEVLVEM